MHLLLSWNAGMVIAKSLGTVRNYYTGQKPGSESGNVYEVHEGPQQTGLSGRVVRHRHDLYGKNGSADTAE